ncbi:MAG: GNAT family N-acetyltransferase [Victivallaceae bacterium]|nr:GNAT family N-acetyltransferase [Victivallaceae bacterium]
MMTTNPAFDIRPARAREAVEVSRLAALCFEHDLRCDYEPDGAMIFTLYTTPQAIGERWSGGGCAALVATDLSGTLVGMVEFRDFREITMLLVDPMRRRVGIGRALLDRMRLICRIKNPAGRFTVLSSHNAVGFYERYGFTATGDESVECGVVYTPMELPAP